MRADRNKDERDLLKQYEDFVTEIRGLVQGARECETPWA